ncbi:hypothetical protein [Burkholderia multivorans]|uniref:hypothetical protein n=1 Tax=Burkholderia multivorans TaxID=87883 RepID=UPI002ED159D1
MIDQDKMRALAHQLRAWNWLNDPIPNQAADAIDLLLAEVEAAEQQQQSLTSLLAECRNVAYVEGYAENFLSAAVGSPDDVPAFVGQTVTELRTKLEAAEKDAERYRALRRGQHWSVLNGIGDTLRADELDAAIDAAREGDAS